MSTLNERGLFQNIHEALGTNGFTDPPINLSRETAGLPHIIFNKKNQPPGKIGRTGAEEKPAIQISHLGYDGTETICLKGSREEKIWLAGQAQTGSLVKLTPSEVISVLEIVERLFPEVNVHMQRRYGKHGIPIPPIGYQRVTLMGNHEFRQKEQAALHDEYDNNFYKVRALSVTQEEIDTYASGGKDAPAQRFTDGIGLNIEFFLRQIPQLNDPARAVLRLTALDILLHEHIHDTVTRRTIEEPQKNFYARAMRENEKKLLALARAADHPDAQTYLRIFAEVIKSGNYQIDASGGRIKMIVEGKVFSGFGNGIDELFIARDCHEMRTGKIVKASDFVENSKNILDRHKVRDPVITAQVAFLKRWEGWIQMHSETELRRAFFASTFYDLLLSKIPSPQKQEFLQNLLMIER